MNKEWTVRAVKKLSRLLAGMPTPSGKFAAGDKVAWKSDRARVGIVKRVWTRLGGSGDPFSYDVAVGKKVEHNVPGGDLVPVKASWDQEVI